MKYQVFARLGKGDDTTYIGGVEAPNDRLARVYAYEMYDEEDWDYLAVARDEDVIEVDVEDPPTAGGGPP
ncbi:MAG: phenylacetic acid degradation PaaB family protein [Halobacteriales archaeon]